MIEISHTDTLCTHPHGPHFIKVHDRHLIESDGEEAYELPLSEFVTWLESHLDDPLAIEAVALITNNHGIQFKHWLFREGERATATLFVAEPESQSILNPIHPARILGDKRSHPAYPDSAPLIGAYISELLTIIGIRPNMSRINAEFCSTCGKRGN